MTRRAGLRTRRGELRSARDSTYAVAAENRVAPPCRPNKYGYLPGLLSLCRGLRTFRLQAPQAENKMNHGDTEGTEFHGEKKEKEPLPKEFSPYSPLSVHFRALRVSVVTLFLP